MFALILNAIYREFLRSNPFRRYGFGRQAMIEVTVALFVFFSAGVFLLTLSTRIEFAHGAASASWCWW